MRRTSVHVFALISTISLDPLHATKIDDPSVEGSAHVGEHELSPGFGGSEPCPWIECVEWVALTLGGPLNPFSRFLVTTNCRVAFNVRVSISTSISFIMHAEYCFVPCGFKREPCGIVHVGMRATSVIVCVETTETVDGAISPCKLKLTTNRKLPSGEMSNVAGNNPRVALPITASFFVEYFQTVPNGRPCAIERSEERRVGKECRSRW